MKSKIAMLALLGAALLAACSAAPTRPTAAPQPSATAVMPPTEAPVVAPTDAPAAPPAQSPTETAAAAATEPTVAPTDTAAPTPESTAAPTEAPQVAVANKINLNSGTAEQFLTVPNVGNRMVREFQEYRPYASILQFRREIGKYVDGAQVAEYEKYVYVPVVPNDADQATLQQLPGVDAAVAGQLVAARPYATREAFIAKLTELVGAGPAAAGQSMVAE